MYIKVKVVIFYFIFWSNFVLPVQKTKLNRRHEKGRICVHLQWWLAAVAGEYASTSSVFRAFLSIIHENEVLWSNHCTVLCMRSSYSGEFKSDERASEPSVHFVNTTVTIFNITTRGARMRELFLAQCLRNAAMSLTTLAVRIIVHIRSKRVSSCQHISYSLVLRSWSATSRRLQMKYVQIRVTSDHERDDTTDYCDTQETIQNENSKKSKPKVTAFILSVLKIF